jgi:hypothetical protein
MYILQYNDLIKNTFVNYDKAIITLINEYIFMSKILSYNDLSQLGDKLKIIYIDDELSIMTNVYFIQNNKVIDQFNTEINNISLDDKYRQLFSKLLLLLTKENILKNINKSSKDISSKDKSSKYDSDSITSNTSIKNDSDSDSDSDSESDEVFKQIITKQKANQHNINNLNKQKEDLIESKNIFAADLKIYTILSTELNKNKDKEIPVLFKSKYPIFKKLEQDNNLTWEGYMENEPTDNMLNDHSFSGLFNNDEDLMINAHLNKFDKEDLMSTQMNSLNNNKIDSFSNQLEESNQSEESEESEELEESDESAITEY